MPKLNLEQILDEDILNFRRGIEKESLRVDTRGNLSYKPHPKGLGSPLTHPNITTDFSEAQLELITDTHQSVSECLDQLRTIHKFVSRHIEEETLWCASMPCSLPNDEQIPIAEFGLSDIGLAKTIYRRGLAVRYGRRMQTISGIHFNFSLPDTTWARVFGQNHTETEILDIKNENYFGLIRNFRRNAWLLLYLFGASPAVCECFVEGRVHHLQNMTGRTRFLPYATSLRMGPLGYQSDAQSAISVSYNNLRNYAQSLYDALTKPYPPYAAIGLKNEKKLIQLSTSLLQIENEFYSTIRPKQPAQSGERPLLALNRRGVEYVEVRCVDLDPYNDIGISKETIAFLETFLMYCLLSNSDEDTVEENVANNANQNTVAERGREPLLKLCRANDYVDLRDWAKEIIGNCVPIAEKLDQVSETRIHVSALEQALSAVEDPNLTPSAKILKDVEEKHNGSYFSFIMNLSSSYTAQLRESDVSERVLNQLDEDVISSFERHQELEKQQSPNFEDFRKDYVSQEASRKILEANSEND